MVKECSKLEPMKAGLLALRRGPKATTLPAGFVRDYSRTHLGSGIDVFETAVRAFEDWREFDLGWVRVANAGVRIAVGEIVAVQVKSLGLWSLNLSQIVDVTREDDAVRFLYKTTPMHVEQGEERFLLTFDASTGEVHYELEAVSKPRHWLARLGYPLTRAFQHRFARHSHRCLQEAVAAES